jgi:glycogen debranching enzyme
MRMQEEAIVELAQELFYNKALVKFDGEWVGAIAAIPRAHPANAADLNYGEIFIRDNVPVMAYLLLQGHYAAVRNFLHTCLQLQSDRAETRGVFPTSFVEVNGQMVADYGQRAIGRVVSVDATLWWAILAHAYVKRSGDRAFACLPEVQVGISHFLDLILHPSFREAPTLYVPDGAFMIDRPMDVWGAPLEVQSLLYGSLLSAAGLIQIALEQQSTALEERFQQCLAYARRLRRYMLRQYWVNGKTVQVLRRRPTEQYGDTIENEYNIQTETIPHWLQDWLGDRGGYLIGNIRTGRPDFRFFTLGNCLGAMFDVISVRQQAALFRLVLQNQTALVAQMPLRICHPPLSDVDWRRKTGYDRKNLPWCYHNAGHWPCLLWFLVAATLRHQQHQQEAALAVEMNELLDTAYQRLLKQLPRQNWAEYFDGPTGTWMGQQARLYQTWTIVGFLLVHHFLKVNPADATVLDVPRLQDLRS